jgi:hypothetical protein
MSSGTLLSSNLKAPWLSVRARETFLRCLIRSREEEPGAGLTPGSVPLSTDGFCLLAEDDRFLKRLTTAPKTLVTPSPYGMIHGRGDRHELLHELEQAHVRPLRRRSHVLPSMTMHMAFIASLWH